VPLLIAIARCDDERQAAVLGWIASFLFFFVVLHPLVSVHSWVGWVRENQAQNIAERTVSGKNGVRHPARNSANLPIGV